MVNDSILDTTKVQLGVDPEDDSYDIELIAHINSTFFILNQLGIGPEMGYFITSKENKWAEFASVEMIAAVITYMRCQVKLLFDPPATGPATEALERLAGQMEWRLNIHREGVKWAETSTTFSTISE